MPIRSVLFDFDGVLIDSLPCMRVAWQSVMQTFSLSTTFEDYACHIGRPFLNILSLLEIPPLYHTEIKSHYFIACGANSDLVSLQPYARELITSLKTLSIPCGLVTSKDYKRTLDLVAAHQLNLDVITTPEMTSQGKPHPEPILFTLRQLDQTAPRESLFIGDMQTDMDCALASGVRYLHYSGGYQKLTYHSYGGRIDHLSEVLEYIKNTI